MPRDTIGLVEAPHAEKIAVVDRAAAWLRTKGWCQLQMGQGEQRCVLGALHEAVGRRFHAIVPFVHIANEIVGEPAHIWQDRPGRTVEDVLDLLDEMRRHFEEAE